MLSLAVPAPRLTGWIWKNVSAFTFPHCLFTFFFFFFTFLTNKSLKASYNYKSSGHVCTSTAMVTRRWDSDSKWDFLFSFIFYFFVCAVHLLPLQLLFDGVMEKANWTSGEETKSRFLWWKPEVSTGCRTSKLHFPATHRATQHTSQHFFFCLRVRVRACMCAECIEEPSVQSRFCN